MTGAVYVLKNNRGNFKIGHTFDDPIKRQWGCQTGEATDDLQLVLVVKVDYPDVLEKELHRLFYAKKTRKYKTTGEWFDLTADDLQVIKAKGACYEVTEDPSRIGWSATDAVQPLSWGQQHKITSDGENVPHKGYGFDNPIGEPLFASLRRKW